MNFASDHPKSRPLRENDLAPPAAGWADCSVCYVLAYRAPDYIRTISLLKALKACPGVRVIPARNSRPGLLRYVEALGALLRIRWDETPDAYLLGFRGHEIFWLVRWITRGKPLIFDALMSPYAAMKEEGKGGMFGKLIAPAVRRLERRVLSRADAVLTDTQLHADYFVKTFGISPTKVVNVPVGAVETFPSRGAATQTSDGLFNVLFYGSFLALHGIDVIVDAAAQLKDLPIRFDFIGGRKAQEQHFRRACARLGVLRYTYRRWVPFDRLVAEAIPCASVCLGGPFGGTPQALRVITGKTAQCLALGKATVIGKIDEDYGFVDRVNCLLVEQNNSNSLAAALRWAYENRATLCEIGMRGQLLYNQRLSIEVIVSRMSKVLQMIGVAAPRASP
jgi:glycosyltransferase involved in cell wall biosynthesis